MRVHAFCNATPDMRTIPLKRLKERAVLLLRAMLGLLASASVEVAVKVNRASCTVEHALSQRARCTAHTPGRGWTLWAPTAPLRLVQQGLDISDSQFVLAQGPSTGLVQHRLDALARCIYRTGSPLGQGE